MSEQLNVDKRKHLRYELIDFGVISGKGHEPIQCVIVDISLGGLQIRSKSCLPVGTQVKLKVARTSAPPLTFKGEVRHSSLLPQSDIFASGFRFLPETHEERISIAEYVHDIFLRQAELLTG